MDNKLKGVFLLCTAGMVTAIGTSAASIANAIVLGGFYAGTRTGLIPAGPQEAGLDKLLIFVIVVLVISGLCFLIIPDSDKKEK